MNNLRPRGGFTDYERGYPTSGVTSHSTPHVPAMDTDNFQIGLIPFFDLYISPYYGRKNEYHITINTFERA
jgi:hypothetical protein